MFHGYNHRKNMKRYIYNKVLVGALAMMPLFAMAQSEKGELKFRSDDNKHDAILITKDTIKGDCNNGMSQITVMNRNGYTLTPIYGDGQEDFFTAEKVQSDQVLLKFGYNMQNAPLYGTLKFTAPDGSFVDVVVEQDANNAAANVETYKELAISSATASQSESGQGIERSYDGNLNTLYHSPYGSNTTFPVELVYTLKEADRVDYMIYTPRQDGTMNGNFGNILVEYATGDDVNTFKTLETRDLGQSSAASVIYFGKNGIENVKKVRVSVKDGASGFASCAEMKFCQHNGELTSELAKYFEDSMCTKLKSSVTEDVALSINDPFVKQLVFTMLQGNYVTDFRVGEYEAYEPIGDLSRKLLTTTYNAYENPTGLYFQPGKSIVAIVDGIGNDPVSLKIKNWGKAYEDEPQSESSYALMNGVNVITPSHRGNGYISYYTRNYASAPNVKIHFVMADVNGYFDAERGHTNEDWQKMLANACSDIMDFRTKRLQMAAPVARFKKNCPVNAEKLAGDLDSTIYYERDVMGLIYFDKEPKNRQFARVVWSGFMFADGVGAASNDNAIDAWLRTDGGLDFWGLAHELGHNNQITPDFKWSGCGETTNNIYSAWVQFHLGTGEKRLEHEWSGIDDYSGMRGGRMQTYMEQGVRLGVAWQLQDGPDYHGATPNIKSVPEMDYNGNYTGKTVSTGTRNYDHFVKLVPLWQLLLYCDQAGYSPHVYGKVIESYRKESTPNISNGKRQMRFMKLVCDSTGLNFLPFFEKAGMLRPICAYIEDYSAGWNMISEDMINELKQYVAEKGYPMPQGEVNYISANNWRCYAEKLAVSGTLNDGCTKSTGYVTVDHNKWKNVVAYETYDANGNLLRITMAGLGCENIYNTYTKVLYPSNIKEKSAYIMAVGWDGTRVKCYQP